METCSLHEDEAQKGQQDAVQQVAAKIIQRAWRRYVCREVFRHIQKLISRCNQLDPQTVLRTVNPREAELLDSAAGVFIRFRLGGVTFPPGVYYKIFTYRPIVDVCAGSPKDYNQIESKKFWAQRDDPDLNQAGRSGWYVRVENNNWRMFCCKEVGRDEPTEIGTSKKIDFRPSRLQRKQDVGKWKKRKKIEWLKQMYREGRLQAGSDEAHLATLVGCQAKEVIEAIEEKGDDEILDWELDELLAWTNSLNFEEYIEKWQLLACSQPSALFKDHPT